MNVLYLWLWYLYENRLAGVIALLHDLNYPLDRVFLLHSVYHQIPYWANMFSNWQGTEFAIKQKFKFFMHWEDDIRPIIDRTQFIRCLNYLGAYVARAGIFMDEELLWDIVQALELENRLKIHVVKLEGNYIRFEEEFIPFPYTGGGLKLIRESIQAGAYVVNGSYAPRLQYLREDAIEYMRTHLNMDREENVKHRNDRWWNVAMQEPDSAWFQAWPLNWMVSIQLRSYMAIYMKDGWITL